MESLTEPEKRGVTTAEVIGEIVDAWVRAGVPGASAFVAACYALLRDTPERYTVEEIRLIAYGFGRRD